MKQEQLILSIDAGTQSIRAVLFDLKGTIVELVKTEIEPYFSTHPGWAEQDPDYFWKVLGETTQKLFAKNTVDKSLIKGVALTTQRGTVINLDKNGKPLRPAMIWLDQRQAEAKHFPKGFLKNALNLIGMRESVVLSVKNGECNWIRQNQPEIWDKTDKYLFLSGFLTYKLIGKFADSVANIVGYVPFDYKKREWATPDSMNAKMFPIKREKLPELFKPSEVMGTISNAASDFTGIPEGLPLIASAADKASEVLGSGVFEPDIACLSYGTTATVQTAQKKYVEVIPFFPPYPGAMQDFYHTEVMVYRGFWMINWFKNQFGYKEMEKAKELGIAPETLFDEKIKDIPAGSMGLTLQPYWSPGVRNPGPEAKGAIIGFGDVHTKEHIYKAILEGLAYALKEGLEKTEKRTRTKVKKVIVSGGGSQSEVAMQLTADIFDLPVEKPSIYETSALGAAINAAVGMGYFSNYEEAVKAMCHPGRVYHPIIENREIYRELYQKVYKKMYGRLQRVYLSIRDITGYPKKV